MEILDLFAITIYSIFILAVLGIEYFVYNYNNKDIEINLHFLELFASLLFAINNVVLLSNSLNQTQETIITLFSALWMGVPCTCCFFKDRFNRVNNKAYCMFFVAYIVCSFASVLLHLPTLGFCEMPLISILFVIASYGFTVYNSIHLFIRKKKVVDTFSFSSSMCGVVGFTIGLIINNGTYIISLLTLCSLLSSLHHTRDIINRDDLTGLNNRRALYDINKYVSSKYKTAFFIIDVDKFKEVNDVYGHVFGDKILRDIGGVLKNCIRNTDIAIRYGGDEFLLIAKIHDESDVDIITNKIHYRLAEYNKKENPNKNPITVSIGSGIYGSSTNFNDFLEDIDNKMYSIKNNKKKAE